MSTNGKLVLYLINRDLVISRDSVTPLHAVVTADADELRDRKVILNRNGKKERAVYPYSQRCL